MCGIVGIVTRERVNPAALAAATRALAHRGPDGEGVYMDAAGKVGLGHRRLSIIDLDVTGAQPMRSADGRYVITFNGEIYNYRDLRGDLERRGVRFRGHSDTEVLLEGFAAYGPAVLDELNGIFAFAIHDNRTGEVLVARDQMGVKPLYYAETTSGVAFASEIKSLFEIVDIDRTIDVDALRRYLTFLWSPGEQTMLKAVRKLEPGSAMILRQGGVARRWTWWTPPHYQPRTDWSARECAAELRERLVACVGRQMVSDAPVGAFLSGGLDSSAVVAAALRSGRTLECFTIDAGGAEPGTTDDLPFARAAARHLKVPLSEVSVDAAAMRARVMGMVEMLDEPLADPACLNVLFISELARDRGMKVLLSGVGGDDLFTGYRRHVALGLDPLWSATPAWTRRMLGRAAQSGHGAAAWRRRLAKGLGAATLEGDDRITAAFAWGPAGAADDLLSDDARDQAAADIFAPMNEVLGRCSTLSPLEKCLELERRFFLADHNLTYTDKMAMAAQVEVRVPFLDPEMVAFASTVPTRWKQRFLDPKWILKQSQRGVLPDQIIDRPKTGFGAPLRSWMHGDMGDFTDDLLSSEVIAGRGLFDPDRVASLRAADRAGRVDGAYTLFSLMCVEMWCRRFVDTAPDHRHTGELQRSTAVG